MAVDEGLVAMAIRAWQRWPVRVTSTVALLVALFTLSMVNGYIPGEDKIVRHSELDARANSADVLRQAITRRLDAQEGALSVVEKESLEAEIRAKLSTSCMTQDKAFKAELLKEINGAGGLEDQYFALTKEGYRQPSCDEL